MKPLTRNFKPFMDERIQSIRMSRELDLADFRDGAISRRKKTRKTSGAKGTKRRKKVQLKTETRSALEKLDPATRAFLEQAL